MSVKLVWRTENAEKLILKMARVSSPNPDSEDTRLLAYLLKHKHYSPFEMVCMCVQIDTTRAISAQIIRHRSFHFQEFSQRYSEVPDILETEARRQDDKNRQNSIPDLPGELREWWEIEQNYVYARCLQGYKKALEYGVAKECARMLLPMASKTKLYMQGNIRDWVHYISLREEAGTQKEHTDIALAVKEIFIKQFPVISEALGWIYRNNNIN